MEVKKEKKEKIIMIITTIAMLLMVLLGSTYAYFRWETNIYQKTNANGIVGQDFSCSIGGGGNITSNEYALAPSDCMDSEYAVQRTITVSSKTDYDYISVNMKVWIDIDDLGSGLANSQYFRYSLTTNSVSCMYGIVSSGTFYRKQIGDSIDLIDKVYSGGTTTETYYLYVWLDSAETSSDTMNQPFNLKVNGSCTQTYTDGSGGE